MGGVPYAGASSSCCCCCRCCSKLPLRWRWCWWAPLSSGCCPAAAEARRWAGFCFRWGDAVRYGGRGEMLAALWLLPAEDAVWERGKTCCCCCSCCSSS